MRTSLCFNLLVLFTFSFNSCNKTGSSDTLETNNAKTKFESDFELSKIRLGSTPLKVVDSKHRTIKRSVANEEYPISNFQTFYLYPTTTPITGNDVDIIRNAGTLQALVDFATSADAIVRKEPSDTEIGIAIDILIDPAVTNLQPLITSSKQYLYSKGFTELDIQDMLLTEGGSEEDLIIFAKSLTEIEDGNVPAISETSTVQIAFNGNVVEELTKLHNEEVREITGKEVLNCALTAIGADAFWALQGSTASSWTIPAMKKAFGAVAKRFLGPIGVTIAVLTFGTCLYASY